MTNKYLSYKHTYKRILDIFLALAFMIVFSPVYIITAIAVFLSDFHHPIYSQERIGKNKKGFKFYKFRSMVVNADEILFNNPDLLEQMRSGTNKVKDDPRITKVGKFIRKYSIDEFPQMFNVLKGDMSFIGPRALRPDEFEKYEAQGSEERKKIDKLVTVKPGITGYWQVNGRSNVNFDKRMDMVAYYVDNLSFALDLKILLKTPKAVIAGDGAY